MKRVWGFIFLSLSLHIFSGTVASVFAPPPLITAKPLTTVELIEVTPKKRTQEDREAQSFAGKLRVPESFKVKKEVKRDWGSDQEMTVLEQTRAADTGLTENRSLNGDKKTGHDFSISQSKSLAGQKASARDLAQAELQKFSHGDIESNSRGNEGDDLKPLALPSFGGAALAQGHSTFAYLAPNIKVGRITALNTDRFVYFGFYQRAEERVYPHWANFVRAAVDTYQSSHRVFGSKTFTARYEVLLRPDGRYEKTILRESSGVNGIDLALAQAFRRAQQIPHPPEEMVKDDGFIHMDYTINVEIGPSQYVDAGD